MRGVSNGIAHLSYPGGGLFLPARNAYDRQMVAELAVERVRTRGLVQILIDNKRWLVQWTDDRRNRRCAACGRTVGAVRIRAAGDRAMYCVQCAVFGARHRHA